MRKSLGLIDSMAPAIRKRFIAKAKLAHYHDGQLIHAQGDTRRCLSIIDQGRVAFSRTDLSGKMLILEILNPGESFGELPLINNKPRTHDAIARGEVSVWELSYKDFYRLINELPEVSVALIKCMADMLFHSLDKLDNLQRRPVLQRTISFLLDQFDTSLEPPVVTIKQGEIAEAIGATTMSVSSALKKLRESGLIEQGYGRIMILEGQELSNMLLDE